MAIGTYLSMVIMNVIKGAVNTLIVCWADAPDRIQENHPELIQEMLDAWCSTFPNCGLYNPSSSASVPSGNNTATTTTMTTSLDNADSSTPLPLPSSRQQNAPLLGDGQQQQQESYGATAVI